MRPLLYDRESKAATAAARLVGDAFDTRAWTEGGEPGGVVLVGADSRIAPDAARARVIGIVDPGVPSPWPESWYALVPEGAGHVVLARAIRNAFADLDAAAERARLERELSDLNAIGIRLSAERDPRALLDTILGKAREITQSDAGSLYLLEEGPEGPHLRFALAQNDSVDVPFRETTLAMAGSVAGWVALSGEIVNLADAYQPPPGSPYRVNRWFDEHAHYRTRSMLVVPMRTPQGETLGALQLINCKGEFAGRLTTAEATERHVRPFGARHVTLATSLASQAAVALHNARLYESVQRLFEGFVKASVTAIEARDPTTSGHSFRVARLSVGLAESVDRAGAGPLGAVRFSVGEMRELNYAALLHDFGKVGVREHVLVKAKKLYPVDLDRIRHRVELLSRDLEVSTLRAKLDRLLARGAADYAGFSAALDAELDEALAALRQQLDLIVAANEPAVLHHDVAAELARISERPWRAGGEARHVLTPDEARVLSIPRGTLTDAERRAIQDHVVHTFQFLAQIPWTRELRRIPEIARSHHEKLDGSGYPDGVRADQIPLQSRIMTIADIYDALTATDRPYKKALRAEEALEILDAERRAGALDADLLDLFVRDRVYERQHSDDDG
jgi:HD-GYP domain-containing protein (c-di-GMP phosphodiesterase class II)